jgi:hypothetical protein
MRAALVAAALLAACGVKGEVWIKWVQLDETALREVCQDDYHDGCVRRDASGCTMYTLAPPLKEFTGASHDMISPVWKAMGHEVAHCFGWEHA